MNFSSMKLAGALLASISMVCAGPAWSAITPNKQVNAETRHKVKAKHKVKTKHKVKAKTIKAPAVVATIATVAVAPVVMAAVAPTPVAVVSAPSTPPGNPYLAYQQTYQQTPQQTTVPESQTNNTGGLVNSLRSFLPSLPGTNGRSILPSIKRVYPTGEKPLVVLTFNCPTELIGITPIPIKALHGAVDYGFDAVNATNLLSFNMQQVCQ
jgi:hypothetical protein